MTSESSSKWKVGEARSLLWERMGDEYVVYHRPSGKTHFLNASGALMLKLLTHHEYDAERLASEIGRHTAVAVDDAFISQVESSLRRFERLGLVSEVSSSSADPR